MAAQKSIDDCYFYYYSSCTKGEFCPFRHCELALGTETVCTSWKEGRCYKTNCKFRHMESKINRSMIPCYWENQPGGCRKPHCVFYHKKMKNGLSSENSLILPVSNGPPSSSPKPSEEIEAKPSPSISPRLEEDPDSTSVPVAPIVVTFEEESDNESVSSTPMKASSDSIGLDQDGIAKQNLLSKLSGEPESMDFKVKTLEQIKMEKIHKESEHFYKSDYDVPVLTPSQKTQKINNECYPPNSEFISVSALPDDSSENNHYGLTKETSLASLEIESDLRGRLTKRIPSNSSIKTVSEKRVINFKKQNKAEASSNPLDFKIKTLDEIRRERENKQSNKDDTNSTVNPSNQGNGQNSKRPKITRNLTTNSTVNTQNSSLDSTIKSENSSQNVLQEVQTNNQNSLKEPSLKSSVTLSPRKRRISNADEEVGGKVQKLSPDLSADNSKLSIGAKKPVSRGLVAFLRKPMSNIVKAENSTSTPEEQSKDTSPSIAQEPSMDSPSVPSPIEVPSSPKEDGVTMETDDVSSKAPAGEKPRKSLSVDDLDPFLMDEDMGGMEDNGSAASTGGDDILLEIDQFLDS